MSGKPRVVSVAIGLAILTAAAITALQKPQPHVSVPLQTAVYRPATDGGMHAGVQIQPVRWYGYGYGYRSAYYRPYWGPRYSYYRPYYRPYVRPYVGYYPGTSLYLGYYPPAYGYYPPAYSYYPWSYGAYSYPAYGYRYW
jgi:hypothetical protein